MYGHRFINIETEEEDNMADNQFASTIGALFQGMDEFVTTKTVVGEPVTVGDAIILPLVDVTCGMAAGAFGQSAKEKNAGGMSAKMTPSAVLVIQNGMTKVVNIKHQDALTKVLDMAPDRSMRRRCRQLRKWRARWKRRNKEIKIKTLHRMIIAHDRMSDVSGNDRLLFNFF